MIHSFLMIGQSNMAGRGYPEEVPLIFDEHIKMMRNGRWQTMWEPVNYDRATAGVSLGVAFAAAWRLQHATEEIGLIPCADGGSSLDDWAVGAPLFENAVFLARLAQQSGPLAGILWHQGESDCFPGRAATYGSRFAVIIEAWRRELQAPDIPLIIGGLGDYLTHGIYGSYFTSYPLVNEALQQFAHIHPHCYYAGAAGLSANPDNIHFNAASLRRFGIRYFEAWHKRCDIVQPFDEAAILHKIYDRPLSHKEQVALLEHRFASGAVTPEAYLAELKNISPQ